MGEISLASFHITLGHPHEPRLVLRGLADSLPLGQGQGQGVPPRGQMGTVLWSGQGLHQPKQWPRAEVPDERAKAG